MTDLEQLREALLRSAFLYDDPAAYRAGVEAALAAMVELAELPVTVAS